MKIELNDHEFMTLLWMARRYADNRSTYSPYMFNEIYENLMKRYPALLKTETPDQACEYYPYAQDGMFNSDTGYFDARPERSGLWSETGTVSGVRCVSSEGVKKIVPGKRYDENWDEIS